MEDEIGSAAGTIWRHLDRRGVTAVTRLRQATKLAEPIFSMALGWLAREGKLDFVTNKRSTRVMLKGRGGD